MQNNYYYVHKLVYRRNAWDYNNVCITCSNLQCNHKQESSVFIGNPFEMRLLNLRINCFYCGLFVLILVFFCCCFFSLHFGQISPLGIRLQDSVFLSEVVVNHLKKANGEICPKCSEKKQQKTYQDEDKKSIIKRINSQESSVNMIVLSS